MSFANSDINPCSEDHCFPTINLEASDNPWPITPIAEIILEGHNSSILLDLEPDLFQTTFHAQEQSSLLETSFDYQKDGIFSISTCSVEQLAAYPWSSLQEGSSRSPIEGIRTGGLDSTSLLLEQRNSASPLYDELDLSTPAEKLNVEQVIEPNIDEGSLQSIHNHAKDGEKTLCLAAPNPSSSKGNAKRLGSKPKGRDRKYRFKTLQSEKKTNQLSNNEGEGSSAKKEDHNAKERGRRMKLNASYLALGAMLPDHSRRSKKRWSAPFIIDRAVDYIPQLENEIENRQRPTPNQQNPTLQLQDPTVSVHEVRQGEVITQICTQQNDQDHEAFSSLLQNAEAEGMCILSASSLLVCDERICYILRLQIKGSWSNGHNHLTIIKEKRENQVMIC